jgi:hypothetical protein
MIEHRHGLVVDVELFEASGTAERDAALVMAERIPDVGRVPVAGNKRPLRAKPDTTRTSRFLRTANAWR